MSTLVAVDLAAKYSAACLLEASTGTVLRQWDTWNRTTRQFLLDVTAPFLGYPAPDILVVEDLPHRLPFNNIVREVCRLQGRFIEKMDSYGLLTKLVFVPPAEWRRCYAGLKNGTGPDAVIPVAAELGYTAPPELVERAVGIKGGKAIARKVATDYCAAYLIARYAADILADDTREAREVAHAAA